MWRMMTPRTSIPSASNWQGPVWRTTSRMAAAAASGQPGAAEYLAQCAAEGTPMALFTACVPELCRSALDRHGLSKYFSRVIYVQEMGLEKRNPESFRLALEQLGVPGSACTMYEDSPGACAAAKAAGLTVVGVYDRFYAAHEEKMRRLCDCYVYSFTELLA